MKNIILPVILIILLCSCASIIIEKKIPEDFVPADSLFFMEINLDEYMDILGENFLDYMNEIDTENDNEGLEILKQFLDSLDKIYAYTGTEESEIIDLDFENMNFILIFKEPSVEKFENLITENSDSVENKDYKGVPYQRIEENMYFYFGETWILVSANEKTLLDSIENALGSKNFFNSSPAMVYYNDFKPVDIFAAAPDLTETIARNPELSSSILSKLQAAYGNIKSDKDVVNINLACEFESEDSATAVNLLYNIGINLLQNDNEMTPEIALAMALLSDLEVSQDGNVLNVSLPINTAFLEALFDSYTGEQPKTDSSKKSGRKL